MNFLAHCALADLAHDDAHPELIAGGVLADFRRGAVPAQWPEQLQLGVRLHRRIDAVSNQHAAVRASCARFPEPLRRLAPIFVDIHADRSLSRTWHHYHGEALEAFTSRCYDAIDVAISQVPDLPPAAHRFVGYMKAQDLLGNYDQWPHVERGVYSVCRRLRRVDLAEQAMAALGDLDAALAQDFAELFPDLIDAAQDFIAAR
jgi:acyl carrier protein phosphodiesterase